MKLLTLNLVFSFLCFSNPMADTVDIGTKSINIGKSVAKPIINISGFVGQPAKQPQSANQPQPVQQPQRQPQPGQQVQANGQQKNLINTLGCNPGYACVFLCNRYVDHSQVPRCQNLNPHVCLESNGSTVKGAYSWADDFQNIDINLANGNVYDKQSSLGASVRHTYIRLATDQNNCRSFQFLDPYLAKPQETITYKQQQHSLDGIYNWFTAEEYQKYDVNQIIARWTNEADQQVNNLCGVYDCYAHE